ncbi:SRPBCC family protein [Streptomyces meridianus]|uniref:SRPBCC domain-containing protein n=1 Tax=Streptomyces meridianus TaxID=2938945 RepID=A0ABT0X2V8_9ACTN|nr:SRPBCC domain-containing protein [Streptomyces meridianus]MCM2576545.1 SRPBCC domain-containing protein [Streptomyces meridianus]
MGKEFEIRREGELPTTPEEYWDAITTGLGGWLWPMDIEPREGGSAASVGTVTVWDPPHRLVTRAEGEDGWFNQLEHVVQAHEGGTVRFRYVHSGVFTDDWDNQYDGAGRHTDFYLHTLGQYLQHFSRRPVTYVSADGPKASTAPDAFTTLRRDLGLGPATAQGDTVRVVLPGAGTQEAVVDYHAAHFTGLRTRDALYRFFGRNAFGAPVGVALHLFAEDADGTQAEESWQRWLDELYA